MSQFPNPLLGVIGASTCRLLPAVAAFLGGALAALQVGLRLLYVLLLASTTAVATTPRRR